MAIKARSNISEMVNGHFKNRKKSQNMKHLEGYVNNAKYTLKLAQNDIKKPRVLKTGKLVPWWTL